MARYLHTNINVFDLEKSLAFYEKALDLKEHRRITAPDGNFIIVYLTDGETDSYVELTWMRDRAEPYTLGDNEFHMAFYVADYEKAYRLHKEMGCICYENLDMDLYFICDPDGYWLEVLNRKP